MLFLDLHPSVAISHTKKTKYIRNKGVLVYHIVYDLLPIQFPNYFWPELCTEFELWLQAVSQSDGVFCISKSVAVDFTRWYNEQNFQRRRKFVIDWFHLGADVENSLPSYGLPQDSELVIDKLKSSISFLMVGTIEPRKGHLQVLEAFEKLWAAGCEINLVLVGKKGWQVDELVSKIRTHKKLHDRLFWLERVSDEYLELIYTNSSALIAASFGEGFGLPLIEAAQHKISLIARDIPVFKEVAGEHAFYFENSDNHLLLADAIEVWIELYKRDQHPKSHDMKYLTWKESAKQLVDALQRLNYKGTI
ncbi:MAG: glycosyltransferase family 1 protein [Thiovulaceae bacterium]|nr:glycosyltransferase family 1 protein [Sulfurimonadaceae bacterium]